MRTALAHLIDSLNPRSRRLALFAVVALVIFAVPSFAYAVDVIGYILLGLAKIFEWLTSLVGFILFHEVRGLIAVAAYSDFVAPGPTAVQVGWVVARDLANMFFILILLVIAFATILSYEEYNIRRLLPRLLIMAVVINFSKTISGILIDFGQVVMLTFVNGFKDAAGGNFLNAFQINKLLQLKDQGQIDNAGLLLGMMLAFIMVSIAAMVVLIMLVTLIFRIVMLWVLIILSPIAFLASTIPPGRQYYQMWWDEMKRYILYGPIVAFFLWLALLSAQLSNGNLAGGDDNTGGGRFLEEDAGGATALEAEQARTVDQGADIPTQASSTDVYLSMIIFASLLFAGLKVATQVGGVGGGAAKFLQGATKKAVKGVGRFAGRQAMKPARDVAGATLAKTGRGLSKITGGRVGTGLAVQGERMKARRQAEREKLSGSAAERAAVAPKQLGARLRGQKFGKGAQSQQNYMNTMDQVLETPAGMEGLRGTGTRKAQRKNVQGQIDKLGEVVEQGGPRAEKARKQIASLEEKNAGLFDGDRQKEILGRMKPEAVRENVSADQFGEVAGNLTGAQLQEYAKKGTSDQREAANTWARNTDPERMKSLMQKKKMKADEIPKEWFQNAGVARHALENTAGDAKARAELMKDDDKRAALQQAASSKLQETKESGSARELSSAALDAIKVGSLTADDIRGDAQLEGAIGNTMDVKSLARGIDKSDDQQVEAAKAAMASVLAANPGRAEKYRKSDQYDDIMPSREQVTAVTGPPGGTTEVEETQVVGEAPAAVDTSEIENAIASAADRLAGMPEGGEAEQLRSSVDRLKTAMDKQNQLQQRYQGATDEQALKEIGSLLEEQNAAIERLMNEVRKTGGGENA